jgi:hypothetical protein
MPLSGCVKTPLGIVAEWFASELKDHEFPEPVEWTSARETADKIVYTVSMREHWVSVDILTRDIIAGAEDPTTTAVLMRHLANLKEKL